MASSNANLRAGPGTNYDVVGGVTAGQLLEIIGVTGDGGWYQLASGVWIAGSLVSNAPNVAALTVVAAPTPETSGVRTVPTISVPTSTPPTAEQPAASSLRLGTLNYDGAVPDVESDEYMEIVNGPVEINLAGWVIRDDDGNQFNFPAYTMAPGTTCRVYTNEIHPEHCGFSFNNSGAIWGNSGDMVLLINPAGQVVDQQCWKSGC